MVHAVQSGHPGGSMGCTEFFVALYFKLLNHSPEPFNMDGKNEDLFFLSNGHISPVFYSVLARSGYFPVEELNTFRKIDSRLQGHPTTHEGLPGIRVASGSLGQGLSVAIGAAEAKRLSGDKNLVFTLHGDGELQEGQVWEAALYAGSKNIDNIIATIDANGQQIDGSTEEVMAMGDIGLKFEAFGWQVIQITDGNDLSKVIDGLTSGIKHSGKGKPICIVMKTEMGAGVDFMSGTHKWHGIAPNDEQLENALSQLPETLGDYPL
jgi:transketolase